MDMKILMVDTDNPGSVHDKAVLDKKELNIKLSLWGDSGYQGIQHVYTHCEIPYKKPKGGELQEDEKEYNRRLSSIRVRVEHVIGAIKRLHILKNKYRGPLEKYGSYFKIACGLYNFTNGFLELYV